MIALAVAAASDAYATTAERNRFIATIDTADAVRCEEILIYADVAIVGLDQTSVYFGGEDFLTECMVRATARLAALGVPCVPIVRSDVSRYEPRKVAS